MKKFTWNVDYNLNRMSWISCKRLSGNKYKSFMRKYKKDNKQFVYLFVDVPELWCRMYTKTKTNKEIVK